MLLPAAAGSGGWPRIEAAEACLLDLAVHWEHWLLGGDDDVMT
jgi:hypothetical protein